MKKLNKIAKKEYAVSIIFLLIIVLAMCTIFNGFIKVIYKKTVQPDINWLELYPFEEQIEIKSANEPSKAKKVISGIRELKKDLIFCTTDGFAFRSVFVQYHDWFTRIARPSVQQQAKNSIREEHQDDTLILLNNGYWVNVTTEWVDVTENIKHMLTFKNFLDEKNIELLYVQVPPKIDIETMQQYDIQDTSNVIADELLEQLENIGIDVLDLRKEMVRDGLNHWDFYYKTDHHWNNQAGLWAAAKIAGVLQKKYDFTGITPDIYNLNNYTVVKYTDWFLGSYGKTAGLAKASPEDFYLLKPNFETDISLNIPNLGINQSGSLFDVIYNYKQLDEKDYLGRSPYEGFLYSNNHLNQITNYKKPNDKKILMIYDSYGRVVSPYLCLASAHMDILDLRQFGASVKSYINQTNPDVVIVMYNGVSEYDPSHHYNMFGFD